MMDLDFSFEKSAWETYLENREPGDKVSVVQLLTFLEGEDEDTFEDAFRMVDEQKLLLDLAALPKTLGSGAMSCRLRQEEQMVQKGLDPQEMEENDPLRLYLEEIALMKDVGDEHTLAAEAARGSQSAANRLTNIGMKRVFSTATEYTGYGVLLMDLIQEGSLGLWQAIQNYESGDYRSHSDRWIRNAIAKAIALQARSGGISQKMRELMEDYRQVDERLLAEFGRNPTVEEIALELHMSPEETVTIQKMLEDARLVYQAKKEQEPEDTEDPEEEQAVEDTAYFQMRQRILEMLSSLDQQDAQLLSLRFGLEKGAPLSPEETGKRLGLTPDEVVSREANALALLRNQK